MLKLDTVDLKKETIEEAKIYSLKIPNTEYKFIEHITSINDKLIMEGRDYLIDLVNKTPNDFISLYNLAGAESLLNRVPEALNALEKAIRNGFDKLEHMVNDSKLENINNSEKFRSLMVLIKTLKENQTKNSHQFFTKPLSDDPVILEHDCFDYSINIEETIKNIEAPKDINNEVVVTDSEVVVIDSLQIKWAQQISNIKSLGFLIDDDVLSLLLEQSQGNVEDVVNLLLLTSNNSTQ